MFRAANAIILLEGVSNHYSLVIRLDATVVRKASQFKFCNMWYDDEEFLRIVADSWQGNVQGVAMYQVV